MKLRDISHGRAPSGYRWVFCRYRRVRNSGRVLDAQAYGHRCWAFLVRGKTA